MSILGNVVQAVPHINQGTVMFSSVTEEVIIRTHHKFADISGPTKD